MDKYLFEAAGRKFLSSLENSFETRKGPDFSGLRARSGRDIITLMTVPVVSSLTLSEKGFFDRANVAPGHAYEKADVQGVAADILHQQSQLSDAHLSILIRYVLVRLNEEPEVLAAFLVDPDKEASRDVQVVLRDIYDAVEEMARYLKSLN